MVFKPPLEYNMHMPHKSGDGLKFTLLYVEESIRLERYYTLFKGEEKRTFLINFTIVQAFTFM